MQQQQQSRQQQSQQHQQQQRKSGRSPKPAMEIYRPPGSRHPQPNARPNSFIQQGNALPGPQQFPNFNSPRHDGPTPLSLTGGTGGFATAMGATSPNSGTGGFGGGGAGKKGGFSTINGQASNAGSGGFGGVSTAQQNYNRASQIMQMSVAGGGTQQQQHHQPLLLHKRSHTSPLLGHEANSRTADLPTGSRCINGGGYGMQQQQHYAAPKGGFSSTRQPQPQKTMIYTNHALHRQTSFTGGSTSALLDMTNSVGPNFSAPKGTGAISARSLTSLGGGVSSGMGTGGSGPGTQRVPLRRTRSKSPGKALQDRSRSPGGGRGPTPPAKLSPRQLADISSLIQTLQLSEHAVICQYIESDTESSDGANQVAQLLVRQCIEHEKPSKTIAKLCSLLLESPTGREFHSGLLVSCQQYLDCRAVLHEEHFRYWLNFINFLPDLFAAAGFTYDGELVQIMLQCYYYMLRPPVLEHLKIDELESLISCLLNVGHELERECPSGLSTLRDTLRDAFILAAEPWARKMLLLLIELSSCGWKLPTEASEYYFQATTHQTTAA